MVSVSNVQKIYRFESRFETTHIFIITNNPNSVPDTIVCLEIYFGLALCQLFKEPVDLLIWFECHHYRPHLGVKSKHMICPVVYFLGTSQFVLFD